MTEFLKIEKNMPLPKSRSKYSVADDMEVGDSVLCETYGAAHMIYKRLIARGCTTRRQELPGLGVRIWRMSGD